jgi:NagD protein
MPKLVVDLDGTLYNGALPIAGVRRFLEFVRDQEIETLLVSNNSSKRVGDIKAKIDELYDVHLPESFYYNSTIATCEYMTDLGLKTYSGVCSKSFISDASGFGLRFIADISNEEPDAIIVTYDREIDFSAINRTYQLIANTNLPYFATHPDMVCPTGGGFEPDIGAYIQLFNSITARTPLIIGKPSNIIGDIISKRMNAPREEIYIVGDRLYTDIKLASDCGFSSILVLSGETRIEDVSTSAYKPGHVLDSVADIIELWPTLGCRLSC